jgi:hypothetical protein
MISRTRALRALRVRARQKTVIGLALACPTGGQPGGAGCLTAPPSGVAIPPDDTHITAIGTLTLKRCVKTQETKMTEETKAATPLADAKVFAKKHRIELEDAVKILEEHGENRKAADKAARRIAA